MLLKKKEELENMALADDLVQTKSSDESLTQESSRPTASAKIVKRVERFFQKSEPTADKTDSDEQMTPAVWLNEVFMEAVRLEASDIHIVPEKEYMSVKFRINGVITEVARWDIDYRDMIISRIKIIAGLQVVEKNIPQDGHLELLFELPVRETADRSGESLKEFNFRVSTMPTINGEAVVLRALNKEGSLLPMDQIGFSDRALLTVKKILRREHGIFLMTGHSGSGKTTTLYSALNYLNTNNKAVLTLEDPVEYRLANTRQSQVNLGTGYTFNVGLKALLRQDPDVIMIGEIRDEETAGIAMRLALVGRLVLTTLHANSISGALVRMTDMDIAKSIVSSAFIGIVAERLVRKICNQCRIESVPPYELLKMFDIPWPDGVKVYVGQGCDACDQSGYRDRIGIFEVLEIDDAFRNLIVQQASMDVLNDYVKSHVVETLRDDGFDKVRRGITTLEEVIQVTI